MSHAKLSEEERRQRSKESNARYRASEKGKARVRLRKYGITPEEHDAMLASQDFRCAICAVNEPGGSGTWHVDHCHASGKVRGLLCNRCNRGLGYFRDDAAVLSRAAQYLNPSI